MPGHHGPSIGNDDILRQRQLAQRAAVSLRQRHLLAFSAVKFKDILRQCDVHGVDHRTPTGATPLMLAARAGNGALVDALLERGADASWHDEFGQTPWLAAVNRALEEPAFASGALALLADRIAPAAIDVQSDGRLVRIEQHQGEYWLLTLMLAGLKTQWSMCTARPHPRHKYGQGFFAEQLHDTLLSLPKHCWKELRRKRSYVNQVLARGEIESSYRPARKLWVRTRNGHYLLNPGLLLRRGEAWLPVYDVLNLAWIDDGSGWSGPMIERPMAMVERCVAEARLTAMPATSP
jgi:hypothetical protein